MKKLFFIMLAVLFSVNLDAQQYLSPREIYLKNKNGVISKTTIREYYNEFIGQQIKQAQFWFFDGQIHFFISDGFRNGWYVYKGVNGNTVSRIEYNDETLYIKSDCSYVEWRKGEYKKVFDQISTKEKYLEYDRNLDMAGSGGYYGGNNSTVNGGSGTSTSGSSSSRSLCRICRGNGRCTSCRGTGISVLTQEPCYYCRGDGKCRNCWGSGRQ